MSEHIATPKPYQCRHIFTDGHQCGSPALRGENLCYYHHGSRRPTSHQTIHGLTFLALPDPADLYAVQRGLCEVLRLCAANEIDDRHATALIRGLSIASANLARIARQEKSQPATTGIVQDFVLHPTLGTLATAPEREPVAEAPLPDNAPILTPVPIITRRHRPEYYAEAAALKVEADRELAAQTERDLVAETPPQTTQPSESLLQVQTYPPSNDDFGLQEKTSLHPKPVTRALYIPTESPALPGAAQA